MHHKTSFLSIFLLVLFCFYSCSNGQNPFEVLKGEQASIESIYVNSTLAKNSYARGQNLDFSNLVVRACFSDGSEKSVKIGQENILGYDCMQLGEQELTIFVEYNGKKVYANWTVTVRQAIPVKLIIKSLPTKTEYSEFEQFDSSGLEVVVQNSDGTEFLATESELIFTFDHPIAGEKTVFVHYQNLSESFKIFVE